mmetsp:Transcript_136078/g.261372  ORF Transcript_136078/g.261372 Transcript_136078/m.261372 type:complete len:304 (-) Transcript_136078:207-1118(-)
MKRTASPKILGRPAAKIAKPMEPGDDPFEVRRLLFKAGGLNVPNKEYDGPGKWTLTAPGLGEFADAEPLELSYFAIRALGMIQQLCCEVAGYPYRYTVMLSPHFQKHVKSTLVFGRLPLLKTPGGTEIVQSKAVVRHTAKICGLAGKSDDDVARCDMLHEMWQTEAKVDAQGVLKLTPEMVTAGADDIKALKRTEMLALDDTKKLVAVLKFWDDLVSRSSTGWMLGGLGDGGPGDLCYVDLSIYWSLRSCVEVLETCGFNALANFIKKVQQLPGVVRLVDSGRLMPNMGAGYVYVGDDLVPSP